MFESILLIVIGIISIGFIRAVLYDDEALEVYMKKSYKAKLWIKLLGSEEKAKKFIRKGLAPFGMVLGVLMIVVGVLFFVL